MDESSAAHGAKCCKNWEGGGPSEHSRPQFSPSLSAITATKPVGWGREEVEESPSWLESIRQLALGCKQQSRGPGIIGPRFAVQADKTFVKMNASSLGDS